MEIQPLTIQAILEFLRKLAIEHQAPIVVEALIALTPRETRLLDIRPIQPLETINF